jgi:hypothetical protein
MSRIAEAKLILSNTISSSIALYLLYKCADNAEEIEELYNMIEATLQTTKLDQALIDEAMTSLNGLIKKKRKEEET